MRTFRLGAPLVAIAAIAVAFAVPSAAHAAKAYRWTDANGVVHYGDHTPEDIDAVTVIPIEAEPSPVASLRLEADGDGVLAWAENRLAGPIEVLLREQRGAALGGSPPLPARATVPPHQRVVVSRLAQGANTTLALDVVPGSPNARPRDVEYAYPLQASSLRVEQGFGGGYSHNDAQNRYAVDFATEIGTPVLAARAGTVMQVESDFDRAGLNAEKYGGRANFVRILHDDGTMALYAHLKADGALVRVGQHIRRGQLIGLSGNTGFTSGPHLHFVVQVNRGLKLESIPFRMFGPGGILRFDEVRVE